MPLTFNQVLDEHRTSGSNLSLEQFAKVRDLAEGGNERASAYKDSTLKRIDATIDRAFQPLADPAAEVGQKLGQKIDQIFGTTKGETIGEGVFRSLPRQIAEFTPFLGQAGKVAKALSATSAFIGGTSKTDSIGGGVVAAGSLPLLAPVSRFGTEIGKQAGLRGVKKAIAKGGSGAEQAASSIGRTAADKVREELGRQVAFLGFGEVQAQASGFASGQGLRNPLSEEAIIENALGNLAFLPFDAVQLARPPKGSAGDLFGSETQLARESLVAATDRARKASNSLSQRAEVQDTAPRKTVEQTTDEPEMATAIANEANSQVDSAQIRAEQAAGVEISRGIKDFEDQAGFNGPDKPRGEADSLAEIVRQSNEAGLEIKAEDVRADIKERLDQSLSGTADEAIGAAANSYRAKLEKQFIETQGVEFELAGPVEPRKLFFERFREDYGYSEPVARLLSDTADRINAKLNRGDQVFDIANAEEVMREHGVFGVHVMPEAAKEGFIGLVGLGQNAGQAGAFFELSALSHELMHGAQRLLEAKDVNDPLTQIYKGAFESANEMTFEQRRFLLDNLASMAIPPKALQDTPAIATGFDAMLDHFASTPQEFLSGYAQFVITGIASRQADKKGKLPQLIKEAMKWMPEDMRLFARGHFRSLAHIGESFEKLASGNAGVKPLAAAKVHRLMLELSKEDAEIVQAKESLDRLANSLEGNFGQASMIDPTVPQQTNAQFIKTDLDPAKPPSGPIKRALSIIYNAILGSNMSWFGKWLTPMNLTARVYKNRGLPVFREAQNRLAEYSEIANRNTQEILSPLLFRNRFARNKLDANNPILRLVKLDKEDPQTRKKALDIIRLMQEEQLGMNPDGTFQEGIATRVSQMLPKDPAKRELVVEAIRTGLEVHRNAARKHVGAQRAAALLTTARVLQVMSGSTLGAAEAKAIAGQLRTSLETGKPIERLPDVNLSQANLVSAAETMQTLLRRASQLERLFESRSAFHFTEARPGQWLVRGRNPKTGDIHTFWAFDERHSHKVRKKLSEEGFTELTAHDKFEQTGVYAGILPDAMLRNFLDVEQDAWKKQVDKVRQEQGDEVADLLLSELSPAAAAAEQAGGKILERFVKERKLAGGREELDHFHAMIDYSLNLSNAVSRMEARKEVDLALHDPAFAEDPAARSLMAEHAEATLNGANDPLFKWRLGLSAYFLGLNFSSMIVNGTQSLLTLAPILLDSGANVKQTYSNIGVGVSDAVKSLIPAKIAEADKRISKKLSENDGKIEKLDEEETVQHYLREALKDGLLERGSLDELDIGGDAKQTLLRRIVNGLDTDATLGRRAGNKLYWASQALLWSYSLSEQFNTRISLASGIRLGYQQGRRGVDAYNFAKEVVRDSTFGGGRSARPGYMSKFSGKYTTPVMGMVHALRQYSLGMTSILVHFGKDSVKQAAGGNFNTPQQKAFASALGTLAAFSGATGLPFAGAIMTLLEEQLGIEANREVREFIQGFFEDDEEMGHLVSGVAMNGVMNHLTGTDVQSRTGLSSLVGMSEYSGFDAKDLLGPAVGVGENFSRALQSAFIEGDLGRAGKELAPQAFKNMVEIYNSQSKYGDLRFLDRGDNLIHKASTAEAVAFAAGFRPSKLRDWHRLRRMLRVNEEGAQARRAKELNDLARKLNAGRGQEVLAEIQRRAQETGMENPRETLESVIDRALAMQGVTDPTASGVRTNARERTAIGRLMPKPDFISEVERLRFRDRMIRQLGRPFGTRSATFRQVHRAERLDRLIASGLGRQEAIQRL